MTSKNDTGLILLQEIENKSLLLNLIKQLNNDLSRCGHHFQLKESTTAQGIISKLYQFLYNLMNNDFTAYLNFLYRIDVAESSIRSIKEIDSAIIAQKVTVLILQREWQKVWFKSKNQ